MSWPKSHLHDTTSSHPAYPGEVFMEIEEDISQLVFYVVMFVGYPLAMCHRYFLYGRSPNMQHIFFMICGLSLCYFNFGKPDFNLLFVIPVVILCYFTA